MTIIVEDGSGLANAESYVSVADADAYHTAMGNTAWAAASGVPAKEAALRRATQYIDSRYAFKSEPLRTGQALAFPREQFYEGVVVYQWPITRLNQAVFEMALRALSGNLYTDQDDRAVLEETVGPITTKYSAGRLGGQTRFALVDDLLKPLTTAASGRMTLRLERA